MFFLITGEALSPEQLLRIARELFSCDGQRRRAIGQLSWP